MVGVGARNLHFNVSFERWFLCLLKLDKHWPQIQKAWVEHIYKYYFHRRVSRQKAYTKPHRERTSMNLEGSVNETAECLMEWERHWDAGFFWNHFTFSLLDWIVPSDSTCPHFVLKIPIERKLVYIILSETEDTVRTGWALQVSWVEQTSRLRCSSDSQLNPIVTPSSLFSQVRPGLSW